MTKPKRHSRGYARSYFGEFDAEPILNWLNRKDRPANDPIERLVQLNEGVCDVRSIVLGNDAAEEIQATVAAVVRKFKVAVAPVVGAVAPGSWEVTWQLVGRMPSLAGLAFVRLLHLADKGLAGRIRKCLWQGCGKWFFARFSHQECCSARCQQNHVRSTGQWKKNRREYMQRLRRLTRERERRGILEVTKKKKGLKKP